MIVKIPSHSVAPRRQAATITSLKTLPSVQAANLPVFPIPSGIEKPPLAEAEGTDNVNPVFEAIRALGTATLIVTATAFTGFWAVRTSMDVKNTEELVQSFTRNMRQMILTRMPIVSSRIHRVLEDNEIDDSTVDPASWNWEDAQQRMKDAYDNEGLTAWTEVAVKELQAEERVERIRRKELEDLLRRKD
ncbi:hypothetical protein BDP27DRAFT_326681 [Rhodocollybia butyracea]|uniref:Uncharacterized protein n=1 Tax=Rhodocollybia butyracea TaxID=206335 RepID=A0A9P5U081_9AGAR|nr:hypothetical protein BDP27DRAFT_326681 [Rhodocollybia butyracea]